MRTRTGIYALLIVGGYFAWQNRFRIQRYMESLGFDMPLAKGRLGDTVKSVAAKVAGTVDRKSEYAATSVRNISGM